MKKLELYFFPQCPYCQIVDQAIKASGMTNKVIYKDIHQDPKNKEFLVNLTGRGTVPCLLIDGKPMHESRDIAAWIQKYAKELGSGETLSGN